MDAYYPTLANYLGLTAKDIAEIAGITERHARDIVSGRVDIPEYIQEPLDEIINDVNCVCTNVIAQMRAGHIEEYVVFRSNAELRSDRSMNNMWPKRGKSLGGFAGPHRVAVMDALLTSGEELDIVYYDS